MISRGMRSEWHLSTLRKTLSFSTCLNYFCTRQGPTFSQYVTFSDKYPYISLRSLYVSNEFANFWNDPYWSPARILRTWNEVISETLHLDQHRMNRPAVPHAEQSRVLPCRVLDERLRTVAVRFWSANMWQQSSDVARNDRLCQGRRDAVHRQQEYRCYDEYGHYVAVDETSRDYFTGTCSVAFHCRRSIDVLWFFTGRTQMSIEFWFQAVTFPISQFAWLFDCDTAIVTVNGEQLLLHLGFVRDALRLYVLAGWLHEHGLLNIRAQHACGHEQAGETMPYKEHVENRRHHLNHLHISTVEQ